MDVNATHKCSWSLMLTGRLFTIEDRERDHGVRSPENPVHGADLPFFVYLPGKINLWNPSLANIQHLQQQTSFYN